MRDRQARAAGRASRPAPACSSAFAASAIARSATSVTIALTFGLTRSIRARCAAITSRAETCLRRMRAASSIAVRAQSSSPAVGVAGALSVVACEIGMVVPDRSSGSARLSAAAPSSWPNSRRLM